MNFLVALSLRTKVLLSVALGCAICAAVALSVGIYFNQKEVRNGLVKKDKQSWVA